MKVNNNNVSNAQASYTKQAEKAGKTKTDSKSSASKTAVLDASATIAAEISPRAKEMSKAKDVAGSAPDIREEKIAELKRRIANKQYNVSPEAVADKMVDEHLKTMDMG